MPILSFPKEDIDVIARISHHRKISNGRVIIDRLAYKSDALATLEMRDQCSATVMVDELNLEFVYVSPASDPKLLIRADCVRSSYAQNLTKYEHDQVQKTLAALAQKDREELGAYAYEIARWRLWNDIHKLPGSRSGRQLKLLTEGLGKTYMKKTKTSTLDRPWDGDAIGPEEFPAQDLPIQATPKYLSIPSPDNLSNTFDDGDYETFKI
jgi:putative transposase